MWVTPQGREGLFSTWRLFVVLVSFLNPLSAVHPRKSVAGLGRINHNGQKLIKKVTPLRPVIMFQVPRQILPPHHFGIT